MDSREFPAVGNAEPTTDGAAGAEPPPGAVGPPGSTGPRGFRHAALRAAPTSIFWVIVVAAAIGAVFEYSKHPSAGVAASAAGAWASAVLGVVALYDWGRIRFTQLPPLSWMPKHHIPDEFAPLRSSLVAISFLYGILFGRFFWT